MQAFIFKCLLPTIILFFNLVQLNAAGKADNCVTPQQFGAKGDGKADDSDAFQKAFDASNVYEIFIPSGTYRINKPLTISKDRLLIEGGGKTRLEFYGKGHFITIGSPKGVDALKMRNIVFVGKTDNADDIIHLQYCYSCTFQNVACQYGANGWSAVGSDVVGVYSVLFLQCSSTYARENGFYLIPNNRTQINNIMFLQCYGSGAGRESIEQKAKNANKEGGNGVKIGGNSINIVGGDYSANSGCGIKVCGDSVSGVNIQGVYFEQNRVKNIKIDNPSVTRNVSVSPCYDGSGAGNDYGYQSVAALSKRNIITETVIKESSIRAERKTVVSLKDISLFDAAPQMNGVSLPAKVTVMIGDKQSVGKCYLYPALAMLIDGKLYKVGAFSNCEYRKVSSIKNGVVYLDRALNSNHLFIGIVSSENILYNLVEQEELDKYQFTINNEIGATGDMIYSQKTKAGEKSFKLSSLMLTNNPSLKKGDYVYFVNSNYVNVSSGSLLPDVGQTRKTSSLQLPAQCENLPLWIKENLCVDFLYTDGLAQKITIKKVDVLAH